MPDNSGADVKSLALAQASGEKSGYLPLQTYGGNSAYNQCRQTAGILGFASLSGLLTEGLVNNDTCIAARTHRSH
jgi:hypothetical protein